MRHRQLAGGPALASLLVLTCSGCFQSTTPEMLDGGMDGAVAYDAPTDTLYNGCRWVPDTFVERLAGDSCHAIGYCSPRYQAMIEAGVAYGGCNGLAAFGFDVGVCTTSFGCIAATGPWYLPDGGFDWADIRGCCGTSPACGCDEICWSPDGVEPPHCIPMPGSP